jgi:hypothetical protein
MLVKLSVCPFCINQNAELNHSKKVANKYFEHFLNVKQQKHVEVIFMMNEERIVRRECHPVLNLHPCGPYQKA